MASAVKCGLAIIVKYFKWTIILTYSEANTELDN